ncbi:MAG: gliding motility-associated C-terminal domain-containing protein [Mangrovibacterium sp.]
MNRLWYYIVCKLALVILLVAFAVAPAIAQLTAYQGQTTRLSVEQMPGDNYTWDLYDDASVNFATTPGSLSSDKGFFVNGINTGPSVEVTWLEPGTYFYRVMAWDAVACTNNLRVGMIVIQEPQVDPVEPPIAYDNYYDVDCDPLLGNVVDDGTPDEWDPNYNIIVSLLEWPKQGNLIMPDNQGSFIYRVDYEAFGMDSFKYMLCLNIDPPLCDTAMVYIRIPEGLDCFEDPDPQTDSLDCKFFIPEGFSPNGDGVHDYFVINCIERYPDAKLMIFDKQGYLLYQKQHYGNADVWGHTDADLWWGGQTTKHHHNNDRMVVPGVYLYILDKGNGDLARGFVMVAYGRGQ